ncbi:tRNA (guanine-N(7)-)-methyltransferase non-catalytic subunit trm82 [Tulasnella sp. 332]|nr:tRNA (guanine-N(7)-)-methyltransferase non-catalytic subunit trm82 [Tulasnella sp. 332]
MLHYPIRYMRIGHLYTVTIVGSHIQIFSTETGKFVTSVSTGPGPVRAADAVSDSPRIVTTGDDKLLKVWQLRDADGELSLELESTREIPKKSSEVHISADGMTILVSDKFGDISAYPMEAPAFQEAAGPSTATAETPKVGRGSVEEKPRIGTLILGHTSVITAFTLTPCNDFIITGDRDEHIRVSWYPMGYNIEKYCLGHKKYVSALHIPLFSRTTLISGGGDPELFVWDWTSGTLSGRIPVMDTVRPMVRVKGGRQSYKRFPRRPDGQGLSRKSRSAKRTRKMALTGAAASTPNDGDDDMEDDEEDGSQAGASLDVEMTEDKAEGSEKEASTSQLPLPHKFDPNEDSFVIGKIDSVSTGEKNLIIFSAVGLSSTSIHVVDLGSPILDFVVSDHHGRPAVWVSTDNTWNHQSEKEEEASEANVASSGALIRLVHWFDGKLVEAAASDAPPLLLGLNSAFIAGSPAEIAALELYAPLSMLPKSRQEEADDAGDETLIDRQELDETHGELSAPAKPPNRKAIKKIAGRANTKVRLEKAKEQGLTLGVGSPAVPADATIPETVKRPRIEGEAGADI